MNYRIGERVGAIFSSDRKTVKFLGFGVYAGQFVPPDGMVGLCKHLHDAGILNPRIDLDSGKSVFGCECWWGREEKIKKNIEGLEIELVDIDELRSGRS